MLAGVTMDMPHTSTALAELAGSARRALMQADDVPVRPTACNTAGLALFNVPCAPWHAVCAA